MSNFIPPQTVQLVVDGDTFEFYVGVAEIHNIENKLAHVNINFVAVGDNYLEDMKRLSIALRRIMSSRMIDEGR